MRVGSFIESQRLHLVRASIAIVDADLAGREELARALDTRVPENWPPDLYNRRSLKYTRAQLQDRAERGWSTWYLVGKGGPGSLLGVCGFKGRPDEHGAVEIAYSVLSQFRNRGVASEAVNRLVLWAFTHPVVQEIRAETMPHLMNSRRVLEKSGFRRAGPGSEHGVIRYTLTRRDLEA